MKVSKKRRVQMKQAALANATFGSAFFKKKATIKMKTDKKPSRAAQKQLNLRSFDSE